MLSNIGPSPMLEVTLELKLCFFLIHWIEVPWIDDVAIFRLFNMSSTWLHLQVMLGAS
jgi:hypothetical protein